MNAIFTGETKVQLVNAEAFIRFGVQFDNPLLNVLIFEFTLRRLTVQKLVVSASVDPKNSAQSGYFVLAGQSLNSSQSLSECGLKIAMAFFNMRFSSSS